MKLKVVKKLDLGKEIRYTQFFNDYLVYLTNTFEKELANEIDRFGEIIYNLQANAYSPCEIYNSKKNKLMIEFALPSGIEYLTTRKNEENPHPAAYQMINYQNLEYPSRKITINYYAFLKALVSNGFSCCLLMDNDDLERLKSGALPSLKTDLSITKSYIDIPEKTQQKNAMRMLNLRREYPDNRKSLQTIDIKLKKT